MNQTKENNLNNLITTIENNEKLGLITLNDTTYKVTNDEIISALKYVLNQKLIEKFSTFAKGSDTVEAKYKIPGPNKNSMPKQFLTLEIEPEMEKSIVGELMCIYYGEHKNSYYREQKILKFTVPYK